MQYNEDKRIDLSVPFLKDKTVLYLENQDGEAHGFIEDSLEELRERLRGIGYTLLFLPELAKRLEPTVVNYLFPGELNSLSVSDMYRRVRELAGIGGEGGFLYRLDGDTWFREIQEATPEEVRAKTEALLDILSEPKGMLPARVSCAEVDEVMQEPISFEQCKIERPRRLLKSKAPQAAGDVSLEQDLDEETLRIIRAWEWMEREFGITIEDLDIILGYRIKLSRLNISTSGKIVLPDWQDSPEVKMDDLTKALYFFYLRHPEGVALKEVQTYKDEFLKYYLMITGRDDKSVIDRTVGKFLDPFENNLNVSISRIKRAFKLIVGDRIARHYYVDGRYGEPRTIALDRDLVIWEH